MDSTSRYIRARIFFLGLRPRKNIMLARIYLSVSSIFFLQPRIDIYFFEERQVYIWFIIPFLMRSQGKYIDRWMEKIFIFFIQFGILSS